MRSQLAQLVNEEDFDIDGGNHTLSKIDVIFKNRWKHTAWCRIEQTKSEFQPLRIVVFAKGEQSGHIFCGGSINSDIPFPFPNSSEDCLGMYLLDSADIDNMID